MRSTSSYIFGILLVLIGIVFFLDNLGLLDYDWVFENFWPVLLILIGVVILARSRHRRWRRGDELSAASPSLGVPEQNPAGDYISESQVFGGIRRGSSSKNFAGGRCSVVFGEIRLDLTQIELLPGEQILHVESVFGSVRLELPRNIEYCVRANLFAGSLYVKGDRRGGLIQNVNLQSDGYASVSKRLLIRASSVFGEVQVY